MHLPGDVRMFSMTCLVIVLSISSEVSADNFSSHVPPSCLQVIVLMMRSLLVESLTPLGPPRA